MVTSVANIYGSEYPRVRGLNKHDTKTNVDNDILKQFRSGFT